MNGILIVDKPKGITSHDVVDLIRGRFGIKKVGHAGTLDPMATGVLVMLLGNSTKSSQKFISDDKEYEGVFSLGASSDTGDAEGRIEAVADPLHISPHEIEKIFGEFSGDIQQHPPMYSAVKYKGRKLYELARRGKSVETTPRKISIRDFKAIDIALPKVRFSLACSKGTYIRQLAVDIGKRLGCGAYLSELRRTRSGNFRIGEALTLDEIGKMSSKELEGRLKRA